MSSTGISATMRQRFLQYALYGRLPLLPDERPHGALATGRLALGVAAGGWGLLVGGYIASSLGALPGMLTLAVGHLVGVIAATACSMSCNRYGVDLIDACKPCFGQRGAHLLLLYFASSQIGWMALMLLMFGQGLHAVFVSFGMERQPYLVSLLTLGGVCTIYALVARGTQGLRWARNVVLPSLLVLTLVVFYAVFRDLTWTDIGRIPALIPPPDTRMGYVNAFELALGCGFSWWMMAARQARQAVSPRIAFYGQALALSLALPAVGGAGLWGALLFRNIDPTRWLVFLGGRTFGALTLMVVCVSNLMTSATSLRAISTSLRHVAILRRRSGPHLTVLPLLPLLICVAAPDHFYVHGGAFIALHGPLFGPLCAVYGIDYFLVRQQRLNQSQLYEDGPAGHYYFFRGFNLRAWGATLVGQALALWLYNPITGHTHLAVRYIGATAPGMLMSALIFGLLSRFTGVNAAQEPNHPLPLARANFP